MSYEGLLNFLQDQTFSSVVRTDEYRYAGRRKTEITVLSELQIVIEPAVERTSRRLYQ